MRGEKAGIPNPICLANDYAFSTQKLPSRCDGNPPAQHLGNLAQNIFRHRSQIPHDSPSAKGAQKLLSSRFTFSGLHRRYYSYSSSVNGITESSSITSFSATTISGNLSLATGLNALTRASCRTAESGASLFNSTSWNTTNVFNESDDYISFSMQAQSGFEATYRSISCVLGASSTVSNTALWGYKIGRGCIFSPSVHSQPIDRIVAKLIPRQAGSDPLGLRA